MSGSALVVGTGLLGTSVGLSLRRAGWHVTLQDRDERAVRLAESLGAGSREAPATDPSVVVVAIPPHQVARVIHQLSQQYVNAMFTDVCSVKTQVQLDVERLGPIGRFVGGHPMAGRERSGPEAARADLFDGRPWVICPPQQAAAEQVWVVKDMVIACGGEPLVMDAWSHDDAVARVSHAPQVVASALAAQLVSAPAQELGLAGQGLRDTGRIAASDPSLWLEILTANAAPVARILDGVVADLTDVIRALQTIAHAGVNGVDESTTGYSDKAILSSREEVHRLLGQGRVGISRVPGKHGAAPIDYEAVPVVIPDEPGELARLLVAAGDAGINVEDLAIEHSPGQPVGLVELLVLPAEADPLRSALSEKGWSVH